MGYISNNNLINYLAFSTTKPHLLPQCNIIGDNEHHHQLIIGSENNSPATASSRWNPTPEQITTLEEVYRRGTRTPTTEQIQQIASQLRKYGRIEGKNVFYWFQNHKSRERLKRRRCEGADDVNSVHEPVKDVRVSSSGGYRVGDQTKSCPTFSNTNPQQQNELVSANLSNNEGHGTSEKSERASDEGKDAMWRNLVASFVTQELGETKIDEDMYNVNGEVQEEEEEEETREIRTLNLFPVVENQEKPEWFTEKKTTKTNRTCCNYGYYYEFMPLKEN